MFVDATRAAPSSARSSMARSSRGAGSAASRRRASRPSTCSGDQHRALRAPLDAPDRDRRGRARGRRADDRPVPGPQHAARAAAGVRRRRRGHRQDAARRREGEALAREGFRTLLSASTRRWPACSPTTRRGGARHGPLDVKTFHQLCEDLGHEAGRAGRAAGPDPAGVVGPDLAAGPRRGDRAARAPISRDRDRRGPGLRCRVAGLAQRAADRRSGGRHVRLPRPGAGDLPRRRRRPAGAGRIPARHQLPQRPADPRRRFAVRGWRARVGGDAVRRQGPELIAAEDAPATVEALRQVLHRLRATDVEAVNPGTSRS